MLRLLLQGLFAQRRDFGIDFEVSFLKEFDEKPAVVITECS